MFKYLLVEFIPHSGWHIEASTKIYEYLLVEFIPHGGWHIEAPAKLYDHLLVEFIPHCGWHIEAPAKLYEYLLVEFIPHSGWHIEAPAQLYDVRRVILEPIHQQVMLPLLFLGLEGPDPGLEHLSVAIVSAQVVTRFLLPPTSAFLAIFICKSHRFLNLLLWNFYMLIYVFSSSC